MSKVLELLLARWPEFARKEEKPAAGITGWLFAPRNETNTRQMGAYILATSGTSPADIQNLTIENICRYITEAGDTTVIYVWNPAPNMMGNPGSPPAPPWELLVIPIGYGQELLILKK